ncbi:MAG: esterase family protein [Bacteroidetes bacterium]|nr:esterase family protein [Bacteroidota bacterium]
MKKYLPLRLFALLLAPFAQAATVDSITLPSQSMNKKFICVVIKPDSYSQAPYAEKKYPVVYLLHGYSGCYRNWITRVPELKELADREQLLIVCPDGGYSSWYWDSPLDPAFRYETYIAAEVPLQIDQQYRTIADRSGRAITGLSMGGHGGIYLGFRHAERFGACGSMSGAVDLSYSINKYDIAKRIGDTLTYRNNWYAYSALGALDTPIKQPLAIIVDCGLDDHLIQGNRNLHAKLMQLKIDHDYIERPGKHDWNYWRNAIPYQLLFFSKYFRSAAQKK